MGNNPMKASNEPAVDVSHATYRSQGTDNPIDVLEGEEAIEVSPENSGSKMTDPDIDRQDSRAPLKDNVAPPPDDDETIVDVARDGESEDDERPCGIGPCRPRLLQWMAGGPKAFALWSMIYLLVKTSGSVYLGSVVYTIEKQFKLSSTESGAIIILNDALDMALVIFVAYFGNKGHRPRIIAVGILLSGLGIFLCCVPHFMLDPVRADTLPPGCNDSTVFVDYCSAEEADALDPCQPEFKQPPFNPVYWLILGQILLGIGNVPVKPLSTTYLDDAVGKHTIPIYIAFLFIAVSIGPLLGFLLGSTALGLYVDFDRVPVEERPDLAPTDARYIGAWWLGFLCIGILVMVLSIPFFFFPRYLPKSKERLKDDEKAKEKEREDSEDDGLQMKPLPGNGVNGEVNGEVNGDVVKKHKEVSEEKEKGPIHKTFFTAVKGMVVTYMKIVTNVALLLLCVSSAMEGANAAALGAFALKYYTVEFAVPAATSSLLAIAVFPFNLIGSLVGGFIIKRRKWSPAKCALFLLFGDVMAILGVPAFLFIGCKTQAIAGVSAPYAPPPIYNGIPTPQMPMTLPDSIQMARSTCNTNCTCWSEDYNPVCAEDGLTYVSPCYAGCETVTTGLDEYNRTTYSYEDCKCIDTTSGISANATNGECMPDCQDWQIPVLIVVSIIVTFTGGLGQSGLVLITLRIVEEDMRSAALGFQSVFLNLLGFFPAPVYFGALINLACILWSYEGDSRGNCLVYDRDDIRYAFHGMQGGLKVVAMAFFLGVYLKLRSRKGKDKYKDDSPSEKNHEQIT